MKMYFYLANCRKNNECYSNMRYSSEGYVFANDEEEARKNIRDELKVDNMTISQLRETKVIRLR